MTGVKVNPPSEEYLAIMGEEDAKAHQSELAAVASLIHVATCWILAATDSPREAVYLDHLEQMVDALIANPEKCSEVVVALLSLIVHLRMDGDLLNYFAAAGVEIAPVISSEGKRG
jgi:hypothetical protein